jgi:hypothetical protein
MRGNRAILGVERVSTYWLARDNVKYRTGVLLELVERHGKYLELQLHE